MSEAEEQDGFRLVACAEDGVVLVRADGDLDLAAGPLWEATVPALVTGSLRQVDVDLGGVSFMDSSGLGLLVKLRQITTEQGIPLRLLNVHHRVTRVLDYSGVTGLFDVSATELEPD